MTPLVRRIRRCVVIAMLAGVAAGVFGMLPGKRFYARHSACAEQLAPCDDDFLGEKPAGGAAFVAYLAVVLGFGALLYREPSRVLAISWTGFAIITGLVGLILTFGFGDLWPRVEYLWPAHAMKVSFGVMLLMIFPIAFVVGIVGDRGKRTDEATARVVA